MEPIWVRNSGYPADPSPAQTQPERIPTHREKIRQRERRERVLFARQAAT